MKNYFSSMLQLISSPLPIWILSIMPTKNLLLFRDLWIYRCYFPWICFLLLFVAGTQQGVQGTVGGRERGYFPFLSPDIIIYILVYLTSWDLKTFAIVMWFNEVLFWPYVLEIHYLGFYNHGQIFAITSSFHVK